MTKRKDELTLLPVETAVAVIPKQPEELTTVPRGDVLAGVNIGALLERAVDGKAAVEVLERLQVLRKELRAEKAKEEYDRALAAFQAECPVIEKRKDVLNKDGRSVRYRYAPLDEIISQVKGLLQKYGFSYSLTTVTGEKRVKSICKITHALGHSEISEFEVPIDPQAFMNEQQKFASALTYSKRYAFCNGLGILTGDEDVDGKQKAEKPAGPSSKAPTEVSVKPLAVELWKLLVSAETGCAMDEKDWNSRNAWLWKREILDGGAEEAAPHLSAERFKVVIAKTKETLNVH